MTAFLDSLAARAGKRGRRIGFPEPADERTAEAIGRLLERRLVAPVAIGAEVDLGELRRRLPAVECVDLARPPEVGAGGRDDGCEPTSPVRLAARLLRLGWLDGVVAGVSTETAEVIRAGLQFVGKAPGSDTVSSAFYMSLREPTPAGCTVLTFADAGVVPDPTPAQLAEIARQACSARRGIVGDEPRVAFLSYSSHGSAGGPAVDRVREGYRLFRERCPSVAADGELQVDAALVPEVAAGKAPGSSLRGDANVLIFPDLDAANIAYKLVQRLAGAEALGPILQGLARPLNDLSRGASVTDVMYVACITSLMAS